MACFLKYNYRYNDYIFIETIKKETCPCCDYYTLLLSQHVSSTVLLDRDRVHSICVQYTHVSVINHILKNYLLVMLFFNPTAVFILQIHLWPTRQYYIQYRNDDLKTLHIVDLIYWLYLRIVQVYTYTISN